MSQVEAASVESMRITLKVWRQSGPTSPGHLESYHLEDVSPDMSFLEVLDALNERLLDIGSDPIAFDHDCREGICGACSLVVNGQAHGPEALATVCQLHMRRFANGDTIHVEPWRASAFPILKDLIVDRSSLDRIIAAGGYVSAYVGSAPDGNAMPISKSDSDRSMDSAACIGCGACVAACPNASAMLFVAAKINHLKLLPQGEAERHHRALAMVRRMDQEHFGNCTNHFECMAACPKGISVEAIATMNREFLVGSLLDRHEGAETPG